MLQVVLSLAFFWPQIQLLSSPAPWRQHAKLEAALVLCTEQNHPWTGAEDQVQDGLGAKDWRRLAQAP